ncbi:hypothetical protein GCM10023322_52350 [Rugosimonospora acidiphila]|uniref:Uncharacterized protein n=1 Tax=Rugosimonospora acidiphila TaxID=556531 RepID=A0ABP9S7V3_9ACTN
MPIYEVELPPPARADEQGQAEFLGLAPSRQTVRRSAPPEWLRSYVEPEPVQIDLIEGAGPRWRRHEQGALSPTASG